ncbi:Lrp/AsnC ligand binding domain-containing protein [Nitrospinae bacterium AH_259_B05_G02_I21]|nr:Lrp/AsnC ligand binding domain-containing protein [Nitrospinae bacterium AH_259_B05_G02_I21]MDA2932115.1 Lrp/AsnC ligand binding domain-containing protein [Nitrospinae bacterium AH-259-F20]
MIRGFILISLLAGFEASAISQITVIPGVQDVTPVFGQWDAIVVAEADSLHAMATLVVNQVRGVQGVDRTETLIATEL